MLKIKYKVVLILVTTVGEIVCNKPPLAHADSFTFAV